ncbi:MAG: hypothetical protein COB01_07455 [Lutibacter sp.]|nr:MAG: hypothetical protein COB01_07455 [Lutibacter sp.]
MKKQIYYGLVIGIICLSLSSCGISKEIRVASINLVEKQKVALEAHKSFHKATIGTLSMYLDAELIRSNKVYADALKNYNKAMLDEIKKIYSNTSTTEVDKKWLKKNPDKKLRVLL